MFMYSFKSKLLKLYIYFQFLFLRLFLYGVKSDLRKETKVATRTNIVDLWI